MDWIKCSIFNFQNYCKLHKQVREKIHQKDIFFNYGFFIMLIGYFLQLQGIIAISINVAITQ